MDDQVALIQNTSCILVNMDRAEADLLQYRDELAPPGPEGALPTVAQTAAKAQATFNIALANKTAEFVAHEFRRAVRDPVALLRDDMRTNNEAHIAAVEQVRPGGSTRPRTFSSTDAEAWLQFIRHFRTCKRINQWGDNRAKNELEAAMDGKAAGRVQRLEVDTYNTFDDMVTAYEGKFIHVADGQLARAEFYKAKQLKDETALDWHGRLEQLHLRAWRNVDDHARNLDEPLIHSFIEGLHNPTIYAKVIEARPANFAACLTQAQNQEAVVSQVQNRMRQAKANGQTLAMLAGLDIAAAGRGKEGWRKGGNGPNPPSGSAKVRFAGTPGCWECGSMEHQGKHCVLRKKKRADAAKRAGGQSNYSNRGGGGGQDKGSYSSGGRFFGNSKKVNSMGGEQQAGGNDEDSRTDAAPAGNE